MRDADDFVVGFQYGPDAERCLDDLRDLDRFCMVGGVGVLSELDRGKAMVRKPAAPHRNTCSVARESTDRTQTGSSAALAFQAKVRVPSISRPEGSAQIASRPFTMRGTPDDDGDHDRVSQQHRGREPENLLGLDCRHHAVPAPRRPLALLRKRGSISYSLSHV